MMTKLLPLLILSFFTTSCIKENTLVGTKGLSDLKDSPVIKKETPYVPASFVSLWRTTTE